MSYFLIGKNRITNMAKLNERDKERIIELLEKGEDLPLGYKHILFPPEKKEYELVYAGKERGEDISSLKITSLFLKKKSSATSMKTELMEAK
jgi:hypothetical protein